MNTYTVEGHSSVCIAGAIAAMTKQYLEDAGTSAREFAADVISGDFASQVGQSLAYTSICTCKGTSWDRG